MVLSAEDLEYSGPCHRKGFTSDRAIEVLLKLLY